MRSNALRAGLLAVVLVAASGCSDKNSKGPQVADSTSQPAYAIRYPDTLAKSTATAANHETAARAAMGKWSAFPGQLKDPDWKVVGDVVAAAAEDGKSAGYDREAEQQAHVQRFMDDEREEIVKKVGGSAQYVNKQAGCNADVYGAISIGLKDAVDDRFKKRIRERGDAYILIERNQEKIGKANVGAVQDQAASVAETSWRVNIGMQREHDRLEELAAESSSVRSTLDDFIDDEKKLQAEPGRSADEKKSSQERVALAEKSKGTIDANEQAAKDALGAYEEKQKQLKKELDEALAALKQAIDDKAASAPAKKK